MPKYISPNRINGPEKIIQPPPRSLPPKEPINPTLNTVLRLSKTRSSDPISDENSSLYQTALWLKENQYPVLPEKTTIIVVPTIDNMALVVAHCGNSDLRYRANARALDRISHSSPMPRLKIFVEYVVEGQSSKYENLQGWDKIIIKPIPLRDRNIFQKEAMWTTGAEYAFSQDGIEHCVFLDADCAFEDNSWAYYCHNDLNNKEFIQPYSGMYYSEQPDMQYSYGKANIYVSIAYALAHGRHFGTPGGAYACTKNFFYETLGGHWPYSSLGSGDALFWATIKGKYALGNCPHNYDFKLADEVGTYSDVPVGYSNQILIHFYHGPISNRMYVTRDYVVKRCAILPSTEIHDDGSHVLSWANTIEGELLRKSADAMVFVNKEREKEKRSFGIADIKPMFQRLRNETYGAIVVDTASLYIVTYYRKGCGISPSDIKRLEETLSQRCKSSYTFLVFTDDVTLNVNAILVPINLSKSVCSGVWNVMNIFSKDYLPTDNVLFIDPTVSIISDFTIPICLDKYIHMARSYGNSCNKSMLMWDHKLMYFKGSHNLLAMYNKFVSESNNYLTLPEYRYVSPAEYIAEYARSLSPDVFLRNIISDIDYTYESRKNDDKWADFILKD